MLLHGRPDATDAPTQPDADPCPYLLTRAPLHVHSSLSSRCSGFTRSFRFGIVAPRLPPRASTHATAAATGEPCLSLSPSLPPSSVLPQPPCHRERARWRRLRATRSPSSLSPSTCSSDIQPPERSSTAVGSGEVGGSFVNLSCSFLFLLGDSPPSSFLWI
jgi:hypothetical protein